MNRHLLVLAIIAAGMLMLTATVAAMNITRRKARAAAVMATALLLMVMGCGNLDPYAKRFPHVILGDDSQRVIETMGGRPDVVNSVEIPVLKAEQWAWRAPGIRGHVYIVLLIMDHTAAKVSID